MSTINHRIERITPEQARLWLACNYRHQRPLSPRHVARLAQAMREGKFAPVEPISFAVLNKETHLVNGQHTLNGIIEANLPQTMIIVQHEVESEEEEANLYLKFDRSRNRNFGDGTRALGLTDEMGLSPNQIGRLASALRFAKNNFGTLNADIVLEDVLEWVQYWTWEAKAYHNAVTPCSSKDRGMLFKRSVYSVGLITMRYALDKAREFWTQVVQDERLSRKDPRKALRVWLLTHARRDGVGAEKASDSETARTVAAAWNAFTEDREIAFVRIYNKNRPMVLNHTSYSGRQAPDFLPLYASPHIEEERQKAA